MEACVSIGKEMVRRASEICGDMQPPPKIDLKVRKEGGQACGAIIRHMIAGETFFGTRPGPR